MDRISQLTDDIRVSIISRLPLRDAIATSVLSSNWRHLYTHADNLVFPKCVLKRKRKEEFSNYVNKIDRTLDLYGGNRAIKKFKVEAPYCFKGANLKRWLKFALARRVETLEIELGGSGKRPFLPYALRLNETIRDSSLPGLKSLTELSLHGIRIEDAEFNLFLSSFPLLDVLSISSANGMKNILVAGKGLNLKKLRLCDVSRLESVEIRDMINLVLFECFGIRGYALRINNVPKLTEFNTTEYESKIMPTIPSYIRDQLQRVTLFVDPSLETAAYESKNVKKLTLIVCYYATHQLFPMIEACSSLETLEVEFLREGAEEGDVIVPPGVSPSKQWSPNLKQLMLTGFVGVAKEVEFARFVINKVASLKEVRVVPCDNLSPRKRRRAIKYAFKELRNISVDLFVFIKDE